MKNKMLDLVEKAIDDHNILQSLEDMYDLYDRLQFSRDLQDMVKELFIWFKKYFKIENIKFDFFNLDKDIKDKFMHQGIDFQLDDKKAFYFIINTHTDLNAIISFHTEDEQAYNFIKKNYGYIEALFFLIMPLFQIGIIKMHFIEIASIDTVTKVHDRIYLIKYINKVFKLRNNPYETITFLMIGIDRFKAVIEEFDYEIGDKVLVELSKIIHCQIEDVDLVVRFIGDEFIVALTNIKDKQYPIDIAQRIITKFANKSILVDKKNEQFLQKTVCIGISTYPKDADNLTQVIKNSANFLSEARNKGRSQVAIYSKELESPLELF